MSKFLSIHGALGTASVLENKLTLYNYKMHAINLPGHGGYPLDAEFSMNNFVDYVYKYVKNHSLLYMPVFGYSMGGYIALSVESKYPGTFSKIYTLGTKLNWNEEVSAQESEKLNAEKMQKKIPQYVDYLIQLHGLENWESVLANTKELMNKLGSSPILNEETLRKVKAPVYIHLGDKDNMVTENECKRFVNLLPKSKFNIVENCPHPIEQIQEDILNKIIQNLLND